MPALAYTNSAVEHLPDTIEKMLTAAGVQGVRLSEVESPLGSRRVTFEKKAHGERRVITRLVQIRKMEDLMVDRMFLVCDKSEDTVGAPCHELLDALAARYSELGRSDITADPAIDRGASIAETATKALHEEFDRHAAAIAKIAKDMRRGFRSLTKIPLPAALTAQPLRLAANQSGLKPYSKRGPTRKAASRGKKASPRKR